MYLFKNLLFIISILFSNLFLKAFAKRNSGLEKEILIIEGKKHSYFQFIPKNLKEGKQYPMLFLLHGALSDAEYIDHYTQMSDYATEKNFIVVYPEKKSLLNWDKKIHPSNSDLKFLKELTKIYTNHPLVDKNKIFIAGYSSGGLMSQAVACQNPKVFKAIAVVDATMNEDYKSICKDISIPILFFLGTKDMYFSHTDIVEEHLSMNETINFWRKQNSSFENESQVIKFEKINEKDSTSVEQVIYPGKSVTSLIKVEGGGHSWAGKKYPYFWGSWFLGKSNFDLDANDVIWSFFNQN